MGDTLTTKVGPHMADEPLFTLDAEGRWRLAYDRQQWILQRGERRNSVRAGARARAIPGFRRGPGEFRRLMAGGGMSLTAKQARFAVE